ncbi:hypothetical protein V2J09_011641 [Rumex salicifolius]
MNTAHSDWVAKDQYVMAVLTSSLHQDVLAQVVDYTTAAEVWNTLHDLYASHTSTQVVDNRIALTSLKKGRDTNSAFYTKAKIFASSLAFTGHPLSHAEFTSYLLAGLGLEYNSVVASQTSQPKLPPSTHILSHLLNEILQSQNSFTSPTGDTKPEANVTQGRRGNNRGQGRGFNQNGGNQNNNATNNIPGRGDWRGRGNLFTDATDPRPICQICLKPGHIANKCWHHFDQSHQAPSPQQFQANHASASSHSDWVAKDQYVMAVLTSSLHQDVLAQVVDYTTAAEVWNTLHDLYASHTSTQVVDNQIALVSLKKGRDTNSAFYTKSKNFASSLAFTGHPLSHAEFTSYLLAGLGLEYNSVVASQMSQPKLPPSTHILSHLLVNQGSHPRMRSCNPKTPLPPPPETPSLKPTSLKEGEETTEDKAGASIRMVATKTTTPPTTSQAEATGVVVATYSPTQQTLDPFARSA